MRTTLVFLLMFAASAAIDSGYLAVDGGSISREPSTSLQAETVREEVEAAPLGESPALPSSRKRLELNAAASAGTDGAFTGADSSAVSWSLLKLFEVLTAAGTNGPMDGTNGVIPRENGTVPGIDSSFAGTNETTPGTTGSGNNHSIAGRIGTTAGTKGSADGTIARTSGTVAGTNVSLPPDLFSPWSLTEILNGIALAIESERKLRRAVAGAIPSPPSTKGSPADGLASGCASLVLGMAPCIMDIMESSVDSPLQQPSGSCCSAVLAVSTPSAAGGAACACHLLRYPSMLDLQLKLDRVDALFSACDGRHFTNGSFAKLCQETKTLPPLIMFLGPTSENITDSIHVPEPPPVARPATNRSGEAPIPSGVAELMAGGGGRWLLLLTLMWSAFI